jgi:small neutral amino acid transporter SnatA (MarC family)
MEPSPENIAQIAATVSALDRKFRRRIWWRDLREIAALLILAVWFGLSGQTWLRWLAVASVLFVAAWIIGSRIVVRPDREIPSVIERLQQMIRETEKQIHLLRSVLWWYLLPCFVAAFVMVLDSPPQNFSSSQLLIFAGPMVLFFLAIYWLNQWAVRKRLVPQRENLCRALAELSQQS